jgi:subtilisin family serine protease
MSPTRRVVLVILTAILAAGALVTASPATAAPRHRARAATRYIVVLRDGSDAGTVSAEQAHQYGTHVSYVYHRAVNGYAASMRPAQARRLARDPQVESVERDQRVRAHGAAVPWDLDRLDQRAEPLDGHYQPSGDGAGVTAYVIDSGIRFSHHEFEGRAVSGFDAVDGGSADDCNGHGTHVAGSIGGHRFGVAKAVRLVAVRVLDCQGSGTTAGVIAGIDWVTRDHRPGTPAVANMSLGGAASPTLDRAVRRSIADGVTYAVAAGNDGGDACASSPAREPAALTVGASNRADRRPPWSNLGRCVDLYAPGAGIRSAWDTSDGASKVLDGTSMASPHVAGVAAMYLGRHRSATPAAVATALVSGAWTGVIDVGDGTRGSLVAATG